ncbi:pseudouridine synthase [Peribacillus sp. SCS-37]|uniref:pseudouridine synthase n=1 Tax=Paraperibacillus esterisolvens TaxID=3115296 RepID=UPI003906785C
MRIDKLLANMGYGTRSEVKKLLKAGIVKVNDVPVKDAKQHVNPETDLVTVSGETVQYREYIYLMMNKPQGLLSATEDAVQETVIDLLEPEDAVFEPFPVGRLDKDTEGFLLLTNDGQLAHQLLSPKMHVDKVYFAVIEGEVTEDDIAAFRAGVLLEDGYMTKPGDLRILKSGAMSDVEVVISEGKYHQIKRMFAARGKRVVFLKRISMGPLKLDEELELGQYRELTDEELALLRRRSE